MKIHTNIDQLPKVPGCVVTTGSFDGVHIGHQALITKLNQLAASIGGESVLITFYPHVRKVLYPDTVGRDLEMINSQKEKIALLEKTGLDHLVIIHFTKDFAKTTAEDFVRHILVEKLGAKIIVVGYNHYFGYNKEGNYDKLIGMGKNLDFDVVEIPRQDLEKETVGSTKIRKSLKDGKIRHANAYLDHIYFIDAMLNAGSRFYAAAGYETLRIEIEDDSKLVPPDGIYAARIECDSLNAKVMLLNNYHGSLNLPGLARAPEIFIPGISTDLVGKQVKIFVHKELSRSIDGASRQRLKIRLQQSLRDIEELIY